MSGLDFTDDPRRGCAPGKVDPEIFFADRHDPALDTARATCHGCPFRQQCLDRALDRGEAHWIWAGVLMSSAVERRKAVAGRHDRQVTDLWRQGLADGVIALRLGVHPGAVSKIRARLDLPAHFGPGGRPAKREQVAA
jgi:hypothetical protein